MSLFRGISAFPITPANARGEVDLDALRRILARLRDSGVESVGLLGSTGTYAYLTREQRQRAVAAAAEFLHGELPLVVGVGALRTDEAQALARDAQEAGADGLLLAPISYTPLTEEEVHQHYLAVAGATDLPLCVYDNPSTTRFSFTPELLGRLAREPRIMAVKRPLPADVSLAEDVARLRRALPEGFSIGYSGDWGCAEALLAGADAWHSVLGGILPREAAALTRAAMAGDRAETLRLDARLQSLWRLFKEFGSLRVVYAMANMLGLTEAEPPRPLLPLGPEVRRRIEAAMSAL